MKIRIIAMMALTAAGSASAATTVTFEDENLLPNSFYNGADSAGGWSSDGVQFNNSYDTEFGDWSGWSYSNVVNTTTPGFTNQYAVITGGGVSGSSTYAVAYDGSGFGLTPTINLPAGESATSVQITNTTYAYLAVKDGNDGNSPPFVRQFGANPATPQGGDQGQPDTFTVTFTGFAGADATGDPTGTVVSYLADYRSVDNAGDFVLNQWTPVDLTALGDARSITLTFASTDVGEFGVNTPTYVAIDNLTLVPEPAALGGLGLAALLLKRRR